MLSRGIDRKIAIAVTLAWVVLAFSSWAQAGVVTVGLPVSGATDSHNPGSSLNAAKAIDNIFNSASRGWAISGGTGTDQHAVFQTATPLLASDVVLNQLTFTLDFNDPGLSQKLVLGKFRLEVTGDANPTAASGATWTPLVPTSAVSAAGKTLSISGNDILYTSGTPDIPNFDTYTVTTAPANPAALPKITGFRLQTLTDGSLPSNGPGLASNGNFLLSDFDITADEARVDGDATFIRNDQPNTNFDDYTGGLIVGATGSLKCRALLSFDMSTIPDDTLFSDVSLDMFIKQLDGGANTDRDATWELRALTDPFVEDEATWNNRDTSNAWATAGGDYSGDLLASMTVNSGDGSIVSGAMLSLDNTPTGNLTGLVRTAIANDQTLSFILLGPESLISSSGGRNILFFHSDNTGSATGQGPRLTLYHIPEPSTVLLLALGTLGLVVFRRRNG